MAAKFAYLCSLLFLVRLAMGEVQFAERVSQLLHRRASFLGGISLYAETPTSGEDGVCPSYTQTCSGSCCPDGCCPFGTFCFINGDYCCPTNVDCSASVDSTPSCANSSWIMYARPQGAASPYFCCEPNQIALLPNQCVSGDGTYAAASVVPSAIQIVASSPNSATGSVITETVSIAVPGPSSPPSTESNSNSKGGLSTGAKVGITVGIAVVFFVLLGLGIFKIFGWRKQKATEKGTPEPPPAYTSNHPGHGVEIPPAGDGTAAVGTGYGNYPEHISEMPGEEAIRGHELGAK